MFNIINGAYVRYYRGGGINIPANIDLNDLAFCEPGRYLCNSRAAAQSLSNCPAKNVFLMHVERITPDTSDYVYMVRTIEEATNGSVYRQYISRRISTDETNFYDWYQYNMTKITT